MRRIGKVAYELELPSRNGFGSSVFHCLYVEEVKGSVQILDRQVKRLRNKDVLPLKSFEKSTS
ncbi:hypothetical protein H5410_064415 [Solanum commersonii]|uniref:Uncharacterized protein n=1 Tax=Solanum commersonii TaxID=4109 RepID=A0A9J5W054_SOLCO|nr:hypothetical protein H5410_064415 [Solanum commersonii]